MFETEIRFGDRGLVDLEVNIEYNNEFEIELVMSVDKERVD